MSDLTEKFFNEEDIPEGLYYLKLKTGEVVIDEYPEIIIDAYGEFERFGFKYSHIENIEEILAPVPSYEELQALKEENARLKELLKECKDKIAELLDNYAVLDQDCSYEHGYNWSGKEFKQENKDVYELLTKINEVLKWVN